MSDDSFIKEVNDDLRSDQFKSLWERYGIVLAAIAISIVLATAGFEGWKWWRNNEASKSGDLFLNALNLAKDQKPDEALKALQDLEKTGFGSYPVLARMRAATVLATKGDAKGAMDAFDAISADESLDSAIRDIATLRAALLAVDIGTYEDVAKRAETLSADGNAMRHSAREALGLAAWKAGKFAEAQGFFKSIADDQAAPRSIAERAELMLSVITATGKVPAKAGS
ncbi:MAG: tetratricopeptide repeat protein [Rhizobiaceae bacterium]